MKLNAGHLKSSNLTIIIFLILSCFVVGCISTTSSDYVLEEQAIPIQQLSEEISITVSIESTDIGNSRIKLTFINQNPGSITIQIPQGTQLSTEDTVYSNLIVAEEHQFKILGERLSEYPLAVFSLTIDSLNQGESAYQIDAITDNPNISDLLDKIPRYAGDLDHVSIQFAIWKVANNLTYENIVEQLSLGGINTNEPRIIAAEKQSEMLQNSSSPAFLEWTPILIGLGLVLGILTIVLLLINAGLSKLPEAHQVIGHLESGSMADIYLVSLDGDLAVAKYPREANLVERFNDEIKIHKYLQSQGDGTVHIASVKRVISARHPDGKKDFPCDCLIIELIRGCSLQEILDCGSYSVDEAAVTWLADKLFTGLGTIHNKGYLHRDLSTKNIMISHEGIPKIIDFGFARDKRSQLSIILGGKYTRNPKFLPVEIWNPEQHPYDFQEDFQSDIFSLGVILFCLYTGNPLKDDNFNPKLLDKITNEKIRAVIRKATDADGNNRYESIGKMKKSLVEDSPSVQQDYWKKLVEDIRKKQPREQRIDELINKRAPSEQST